MNRLKYLLIILCLFVTTNVYAQTDYSSTTTTSTSKRINESTSKSSTSTTSSSYSSTNYKSTTYIVKEYEEYTYKAYIDDKANLLSDEEKDALFEDMKPILEYGNAIFLSITSNPLKDARYYCDNYYRANFSYSNGVVLIIDMDTRKVFAMSYGKPEKYIKEGKGKSITDNIYRYLTAEEYYRGSKKAYEQMYTLLSGKKIFEPMKIISNMFIAFTVSSFICYIYILSSSSIKKASDKEVLNGIKKKVNISNINITKTGTRSVYSPQSSSSGGSSGGGGGGGHSGGSGGGHSF